MSFFEIEPMGGIAVGGQMRGRMRGSMRGGVPVGGVPVGGVPVGGVMMPHSYGFNQMLMPSAMEGGVAMTKQEKAQRARDMKKAIAERAKEIMEEDLSLGTVTSKNVALALAKDELQARNKRAVKERAISAPRLNKKMLRKRASALRKGEVEKATNRADKYRADIYNDKKKLTQAELMAISDRLKAEGYGMYDFVGGAWYDDLWHGIKKGAEIATSALPFIL